MMKSVVAVVFLVFCSGCAQTPKSHKKEWVLFSSSPDQKLSIDDQFLKKSQESFHQTTAQRKTNNGFLKP